jgi:hypothetical protein
VVEELRLFDRLKVQIYTVYPWHWHLEKLEQVDQSFFLGFCLLLKKEVNNFVGHLKDLIQFAPF